MGVGEEGLWQGRLERSARAWSRLGWHFTWACNAGPPPWTTRVWRTRQATAASNRSSASSRFAAAHPPWLFPDTTAGRLVVAACSCPVRCRDARCQCQCQRIEAARNRRQEPPPCAMRKVPCPILDRRDRRIYTRDSQSPAVALTKHPT